jgi:hypothetical protein
MGIEALGGMGGASVLQVYDTVIDGSEDFGLNEGQSNGAKIAVVAGLGHMNSDESRDRLRKLLKRISLEDTDLIMQVIRSLGKVGTRDDIDALKQAKEGRRLLGPGADDAVKSIEDRYPAPAESSR